MQLARAGEPVWCFELGELSFDVSPHPVPLVLGHGGEHLVQGSEGFPFEPDTLGRRGKPQRGGHGVDGDLPEPGGLESGLQDAGRLKGPGWPG